MVINYLKTAIRNFKKHKLHLIINVAGLAIGITFFILLFSYVQDELTYDRFHEKIDNLYFITASISQDQFAGSSTPFLAEIIKSEFPEVKQTSRLWLKEQAVKYENNIFNQSIAFADPEFFNIFTLPLEKGEPSTAFNNINKTILSHETADRLFGEKNPLDKIISVNIGNDSQDFIISGVFKTFPKNSSIQFDILLPFHHVPKVFGMQLKASIVETPFFHLTVLELDENSTAMALTEKFPDIIKKYYGKELNKFKLDPNIIRLGLHKFKDYHLGSIPAASLEPRSRPVYSYILFGISLVVLILACFNYMNLSIGRSSSRFKEIGTRKVIGAHPRQILSQFLIDSFIISLLAMSIGLFLSHLLLPKFNAIIEKSISLGYLFNLKNIAILLGFILVVGFLSGIYPAFLMSRIKTADIFKGKSKLTGKNIFSRALLTLQFAMSIFLIIGTITMMSQLDYLKTKKNGYSPENILVIPTHAFWFHDNSGDRTLEYFKHELSGKSDILAVTGSASWGNNPMNWSNSSPLIHGGQEIPVMYKKIDYDFLQTMEISLIKGRHFSREYLSDPKDAVIVNQTFIEKFNLDDPVGKNFVEFATDSRPEGYRYHPTIIGVAEDFHISSLHREIPPLALNIDPNEPFSHILIKYRQDNLSETIELLKTKWNEINLDKPFVFYFLDEIIQQQYLREENWKGIIGYSTGFAIFIACLGLFGLTGLTVVQRTKEIGIRKVLGARISSIIYLLSKDFFFSIILAIFITCPLAYYAGSKWLENFAYRVDMEIWIFILSSIIAFGIAFLTVCSLSIRAAMEDPVKSLRYE